MSAFSGFVWLALAVAALPGLVVAGVMSIFDPELSVWAGVITWAYCFTSILDWMIAPKSSDK